MNMEDILIKVILMFFLGVTLGYIFYIIFNSGISALIGAIFGIISGSYIAEKYL